MKNQYVGDINDYRKYGMIRSIIKVTDLHFLIAWMLTLDDRSSDGKHIGYLDHPIKWRKFDSDLFDGLESLLKGGYRRDISLIQNANLLPHAQFFPQLVPESKPERNIWTHNLIDATANSDIVFLDPDNGLEVKSTRYGTKKSSKYLYWREVDQLWSNAKSLLFYQHFPRIKRDIFIPKKIIEIEAHTPGSCVMAFLTSYVVFFLVMQPEHCSYRFQIQKEIDTNWESQIRIWGQ